MTGGERAADRMLHVLKGYRAAFGTMGVMITISSVLNLILGVLMVVIAVGTIVVIGVPMATTKYYDHKILKAAHVANCSYVIENYDKGTLWKSRESLDLCARQRVWERSLTGRNRYPLEL